MLIYVNVYIKLYINVHFVNNIEWKVCGGFNWSHVWLILLSVIIYLHQIYVW